MMNGKFVVIDGTDGSGKGTQTQLLLQRLRDKGYKAEFNDFPQYGKKSAGLVEEYLNGKYGSAEEVGPYAASIFYACDRFDASFQIRQWLEEGKIVIANRYVSSNQGHQGCKIEDKDKRKRYLEWLDDLEYNIFGIPRPDITLFLYVPVEISSKLVDGKDLRDYIEKGNKDIHEEDLTYIKKAQDAYVEACSQALNWTMIDCTDGENILSRQDINDMIWKNLGDLPNLDIKESAFKLD